MNFYPNKTVKIKCCIFCFIISCMLCCILCSCAGNAASAQEYYSIGMAYFELGKYDEAEKWLNRARSADRTMTASTYNLGRLAFETKRYNDASKHFEDILKRDPYNVHALRAAAYTRIQLGDIAAAESFYSRLQLLVPESADSGYNHALVLFAMERFSEAEEVLEKYNVTMQENKDTLLLYARSQAALHKIEAVNTFTHWLTNNKDPKVRYEYAQTLEHHELYARALEEYRTALSEIPQTGGTITRFDIRFAIARLLLIADSSSEEGITELQAAIEEGYKNSEALEELSNDNRITITHRNSIRAIIAGVQEEKEEVKEEE